MKYESKIERRVEVGTKSPERPRKISGANEHFPRITSS